MKNIFSTFLTLLSLYFAVAQPEAPAKTKRLEGIMGLAAGYNQAAKSNQVRCYGQLAGGLGFRYHPRHIVSCQLSIFSKQKFDYTYYDRYEFYNIYNKSYMYNIGGTTTMPVSIQMLALRHQSFFRRVQNIETPSRGCYWTAAFSLLRFRPKSDIKFLQYALDQGFYMHVLSAGVGTRASIAGKKYDIGANLNLFSPFSKRSYNFNYEDIPLSEYCKYDYYFVSKITFQSSLSLIPYISYIF